MSIVTDTTKLEPANASRRLNSPTRAVIGRGVASILTAIVVLGWSMVELVSLLSRRQVPRSPWSSPAWPSLPASSLALPPVGAAARLSTVAVASGRGRLRGVAGTVAHVIGPAEATARSTCARGPFPRR